MKKTISTLILAIAAAFTAAAQTFPSETVAYQGFLRDGAAPANGLYDVSVGFWDAPTGGSNINELSYSSVPVVNGVFTVDLFNANVFPITGARFIEVKVRRTGTTDYTVLSPRQPVKSVPYAFRALQAADAQRLGGLGAGQYVTTTNAPQLFIQNGTTTQQAGGFNLSGTGTAETFNAVTQYNLNGSRMLSAPGTANVFVGLLAGRLNTSGSSNSFFGAEAGAANTTGFNNAYFGRGAGSASAAGFNNSVFGYNAGAGSSTGSSVSLFGENANAGQFATFNSTAIGAKAFVNLGNALVLGSIAGVNGATSDTNVGIGTSAPQARLQVVGGGIGRNLIVTDSNPLVTNVDIANTSTGGQNWRLQSLGGQETTRAGNFEIWNTSAFFGNRMTIQPNGNVGFGTVTPTARLTVGGDGFGGSALFTDGNTFATTIDIANTSAGSRTWRLQSNGNGDATRLGNFEIWNVNGANAFAIQPNGNVGVGTLTPTARLHVVGSVLLGGPATLSPVNGNANFFMRAGGAPNGINFGVGANAGSNSTLFISQYDGTTYQDRLIVDNNGNVNVRQNLIVNGSIIIPRPLNGPGVTPICQMNSGEFGFCSSSLRYKENIALYKPGLDLVRRLRPVTFDWRSSGRPDMGLVAEEVAAVEPLLTFRNAAGEIEGVKYDRVGVVLVNAVGEQQTQIEAQQTQIEAQQKQIDEQAEVIRRQQEKLDRQQSEIEALKAIVCAANRTAQVCRGGKL